MTFGCFECLKALTLPINCGFRSLILKGSFFLESCTEYTNPVSYKLYSITREGTYNYLIGGGGRAGASEWSRG